MRNSFFQKLARNPGFATLAVRSGAPSLPRVLVVGPTNRRRGRAWTRPDWTPRFVAHSMGRTVCELGTEPSRFAGSPLGVSVEGGGGMGGERVDPERGLPISKVNPLGNWSNARDFVHPPRASLLTHVFVTYAMNTRVGLGFERYGRDANWGLRHDTRGSVVVANRPPSRPFIRLVSRGKPTKPVPPRVVTRVPSSVSTTQSSILTAT